MNIKRISLIIILTIALSVSYVQAQSSTYTVQKGDTLSAIGLKTDLTVEQLLKFNQLSETDIIHPGQVLRLTFTAQPVQVKAGDSLWTLAKRYDISIDALRKANPQLTSDTIFVGQWLNLPETMDDEAEDETDNLDNNHVNLVSRGETPQVTEESAIYVIQSGDTLWEIAKNHNLSLADLLSCNTRINPKRLCIGEEILLPTFNNRQMPFIWPVRGNVTQEYKGEAHHGIDIAARYGTKIVAVADGVVIDVVWGHSIYGNYVELRHNGGIRTRYTHTSRILVKEGQTIKQNDWIACIGTSGRSTGAHIHFEVFKNDKTVDPRRYLP